MSDDLMKFDIPHKRAASIKVIGVGGGGSNAVNHMYAQGITDVEFIICNTDMQDLRKSPIPTKIQIGTDITGGRGAGSNPEVGEKAAKESIAEIESLLENDTQMVFITAGMGGGTGTGAAPIIAEIAKDMGILTVGIVTIPFAFEGKMRYQHALRGVEALSQYVDSILIINNETLREKYGNLKITEAFTKADDILTIAARGIAEIITKDGVVNVDFEDVRTVMQDSGVSIMASGKASGENRAHDAIEETLDSPLLNKADIRGAKNILLNFTSGENEITMDEISIVTNYIIQKAERDVNIIWGYVKDTALVDEICVTLIATGFEMENLPDFKQSTPVKVNELGNKQKKDTLIPHTESKNQNVIHFDMEQNNAVQTEISWDIPQNTTQQSPEIRLINPNSPFNGPQSIKEKEVDIKENFDYAKVRQMDDITEFEKQPAYLRKQNQQLQSDKTIENIDNKNDDNVPSKFTIGENSNGVFLKDNNKFLNHNAD